jgi:DNA mismatch repair protein MutS
MGRTMTTTTARGGARYGELVRQYLELRDQHPGVLLLFRVGSFYEVLFEDAELVARELGLKLGDRPSGGAAPPVPQCGFAHHALDTFLPRLLARGYRVAVCEEEERGEADGSGGGGGGGRPEAEEGLRRRAVVRTLTPGTVTDPALLREDRPTYLAALVAGEDDRIGLAWTDVAAGEFRAGEFDPEGAAAELQRLDPAEVLLPEDGGEPGVGILRELTDGRAVTPAGRAAGPGAAARLGRAFPDAPLADLPLAQAAAGVIVGYLEATQGDQPPPLERPQPAGAADSLRLDAATQRHLELVETEHARTRAGSLLDTIDRAATPMGRRLLRAWLLRPLTSLTKIAVRQRIVAELVESEALREDLAARLAAFADLERLAGRAAAHRATPDDLRALAGAAAALPALGHAVAGAQVPFLRALANPRRGLAGFAARAAAVLAGPVEGAGGARDKQGGPGGQGGLGGPVRPDASPALAAALARLDAARGWQARYVEGLRRRPGLGKARLERTSTQGLFLEVPANTPVPADWVRRGGLQRVERYTTAALEEHAVELAQAEGEAAAETRAVLEALRGAAAAVAGEARDLARYLAAADALLSLALVAAERGWARPTVDAGDEVVIEGGRHPVLEAQGPFQPNDARLQARGLRDQVVVLTGPNMAGKSVWMRQVALLVLLAQMGAFVPARQARVGLVDALYTRIGAVDDPAGGRSTFMVEMEETGAVLRGATDRSLVLLDELGRGTSTHDGMAIAWAVIEHLAAGPVRPRAIIATHYHELAALGAAYPQLTLLRAAVEERPDRVVFTHRIEPGAADRSFGIEVARLAGLPPAVLTRAREVADAIEPLSAEIAGRLGGLGRQRRASARPRREIA